MGRLLPFPGGNSWDQSNCGPRGDPRPSGYAREEQRSERTCVGRRSPRCFRGGSAWVSEAAANLSDGRPRGRRGALGLGASVTLPPSRERGRACAPRHQRYATFCRRCKPLGSVAERRMSPFPTAAAIGRRQNPRGADEPIGPCLPFPVSWLKPATTTPRRRTPPNQGTSQALYPGGGESLSVDAPHTALSGVWNSQA
jgi:hypothetical protein